jgi:septum site-determining protein MinD
VDGALELADLTAGRGPDLQDVLAGRAAAVEAVREEGPVPVLPCGRSLADANATPDALADALRAVEYGRVVVDCSAGPAGGGALVAASVCVVVTTARPVALVDAVRIGALARAVGTPPVQVALVHAGDDPPVRAVERAVGAPVVAVPEPDRFTTAMASGQPVGAVAPASPAAEAIARLAADVHRSRRS